MAADHLRPLFNPLPHNFQYEWYDDHNQPVMLSIPSKELKEFPPAQYQFMKRHLGDAVLHHRDLIAFVANNLNDVYKEIEVTL